MTSLSTQCTVTTEEPFWKSSLLILAKSAEFPPYVISVSAVPFKISAPSVVTRKGTVSEVSEVQDAKARKPMLTSPCGSVTSLS